tara:strand:- start:83 stop:346 length:264 start_codon:yes stop_codon:yes gene_type:complete
VVEVVEETTLLHLEEMVEPEDLEAEVVETDLQLVLVDLELLIKVLPVELVQMDQDKKVVVAVAVLIPLVQLVVVHQEEMVEQVIHLL